MNDVRWRVFELLTQRGFDPGTAETMLSLFDGAGIVLGERRRGEFVCRWVNVLERSVPPDADTIIRTVTLSSGDRTSSATHWLEGIEAPPKPPDLA